MEEEEAEAAETFGRAGAVVVVGEVGGVSAGCAVDGLMDSDSGFLRLFASSELLRTGPITLVGSSLISALTTRDGAGVTDLVERIDGPLVMEPLRLFPNARVPVDVWERMEFDRD